MASWPELGSCKCGIGTPPTAGTAPAKAPAGGHQALFQGSVRWHGGCGAPTEETIMTTTVTVLGMGIMGSAMARNLVRAGLRTTVWDRTPAAVAALVDAGAHAAVSPEEAVRDAGVVITLLPTAGAVASVV